MSESHQMQIYPFPVAFNSSLTLFCLTVIHIWHDVKIFGSGPIVRLRLHKIRPHTPCHAFHSNNRENCKGCQACDNLLHLETHSEDCLAMHVHSPFHRTANISADF